MRGALRNGQWHHSPAYRQSDRGAYPREGLLHLFGEDLSKLVNTNEARGARLEGDDVLLFPSRMMPPPHILGKVTAVSIEGDNIVQVFGGEPPRL